MIVSAPGDVREDLSTALLDALRTAYARGARIASVCTGAFAASGLLDGRTVTTHWKHAAELARRLPAVQVEPNVLYTDDGQILTSAGSSAGLEFCLHLVRTDHRTEVADAIARSLVIPAHREGGQAEYIDSTLPIGSSPRLGPTLDWARAHLELDLTLEELARQAKMSPRTFARRFRETTGATPLQWLGSESVRRPQHQLENTEDTMDHIAVSGGFGLTHVMRTHVTRIVHLTPHEFRRTLRTQSAA